MEEKGRVREMDPPSSGKLGWAVDEEEELALWWPTASASGAGPSGPRPSGVPDSDDRVWLPDIALSDLDLCPPLFVSPETSLCRAARILDADTSGCLLIGTPASRLLGIVTAAEIPRCCPSSGVCMPDAIRMEEIMVSPVETLPRTATLGQALRLLHGNPLEHVPVVDDGNSVVGVLTSRAIVRHLTESFPAEVLNARPPWARENSSLDSG